MTTEKIHAVDGTLAFEVGPNGTRPGVRITTYIPTTGSTLSIPLDEDGAQAMAMAILATAPDGARPAAPSAPATPAVGVRASEGATGAPRGAGEVGLGDAIRALIPATYTDDGYFGVTALEIGEFADRADALEVQIASLRELAGELTFKGKGEPDDMPDEFELVRDEVAYMIRKRLGDAQ